MDALDGLVNYHIVEHYKNGEIQWFKWHIKGELTSTSTGETFKINELIKLDPYTFLFRHFNIHGNEGSHYVFRFEADWSIPSSEIREIVCK